MKRLACRATRHARSLHALKGRAAAGFAMIEATVGMALLSLTLGCMFASNAHLLSLLRQGKQSTFATELIQERIEQFRSAVWNEITVPSNVSALAGQTDAKLTTANLPGVAETIRIEPLVNPTNTAIVCLRPATGAPTAVGPILTSEKSVKLTVTIQWTSGKRTRTRGVTTIVANRGL